MRINKEERLQEIKEILCKYNGIPSQYVDKAAYCKIKYFINKFKDDKSVVELIEKWNLEVRKQDFEEDLIRVEKIIDEEKGMPNRQEKSDMYQSVKSFFRTYRNIPEVERLMYIAAYSLCYPLRSSSFENKTISDSEIDSNDLLWKGDDAYEYIIYVYKRYRVLPGENSTPVASVKSRLKRYYSYSQLRKSEFEPLLSFIETLIKMGCDEEWVKGAYHTTEFDSKDVQERIRNLVIENGSCAIKYIADMAIPGVSLPEEFVHYYYYNRGYRKEDYWTIRPLGFIYIDSENCGKAFMRVHYRDYHKCDINRIRESARSHYRDWSKEPPQTLEDWKYYGQCGLFISEGYFGKSKGTLLSEDWSTDIVELSFKRSERYFYMYNRYKYMDYLLFLLEKGYTIYKSDVTRWLVNWLDFEGITSMDESIRQKVKEKLKLKGINLNNLPTYGSI